MRSRGIITGSLVITLIIGVLNSLYKTDKLPPFRFFFGSGILYLFLTTLGEYEEELAKAIAVGICTFTVLGDGGGVIDHFLGMGASNTTLNTDPKAAPANPKSLAPKHGGTFASAPVPVADAARRETGLPTTAAMPGLFPVKPVIPNGVVQHTLI